MSIKIKYGRKDWPSVSNQGISDYSLPTYAFLKYNSPETNLNVHNFIHNEHYINFVMRNKLSDFNEVYVTCLDSKYFNL